MVFHQISERFPTRIWHRNSAKWVWGWETGAEATGLVSTPSSCALLLNSQLASSPVSLKQLRTIVNESRDFSKKERNTLIHTLKGKWQVVLLYNFQAQIRRWTTRSWVWESSWSPSKTSMTKIGWPSNWNIIFQVHLCFSWEWIWSSWILSDEIRVRWKTKSRVITILRTTS